MRWSPPPQMMKSTGQVWRHGLGKKSSICTANVMRFHTLEPWNQTNPSFITFSWLSRLADPKTFAVNYRSHHTHLTALLQRFPLTQFSQITRKLCHRHLLKNSLLLLYIILAMMEMQQGFEVQLIRQVLAKELSIFSHIEWWLQYCSQNSCREWSDIQHLRRRRKWRSGSQSIHVRHGVEAGALLMGPLFPFQSVYFGLVKVISTGSISIHLVSRYVD